MECSCSLLGKADLALCVPCWPHSAPLHTRDAVAQPCRNRYAVLQLPATSTLKWQGCRGKRALESDQVGLDVWMLLPEIIGLGWHVS